MNPVLCSHLGGCVFFLDGDASGVKHPSRRSFSLPALRERTMLTALKHSHPQLQSVCVQRSGGVDSRVVLVSDDQTLSVSSV